METEDILRLLQNVKQTGTNKWIASCPNIGKHNHGDEHRSLSISKGNDGRTLFYCHTGCTFEEITGALGLESYDCTIGVDKRWGFIQWFANANNLTFVEEYSYCYGNYQDGLSKLRFIDNNQNEKTFRWIKEDNQSRSDFKLTHEGCEHRLYVSGNIKDKDIVIVEGEKDAMTVSRILRKTAVSVENGATKGKAGKWLDEYTEQLNGKNVYILWDNDETGKNFANLEARKLLGNVAHVYMIDLTEAWPECPEKGDVTDMEKAIGRKETADRIKALFEKAKPYELTLEDGEQMEIDLEKNDSSDEVFDTMENYLDNILPADIKDFSTYKGRKTGFNNLDNVIGSLYPGFYVVGALSSLGKTTFCHQLADQMAERGEHILYFSLEQSRLEMVTKSLSRTMAKKNMDKAFSSLQIRTGKTSQELQEAIQKYKNVVGNNMNIVQGNLETNIKTVETLTESYIIRKQVKPIVFIDYLQILQGDPTKDFSMLKQCVDDNVKRLKQLSEKFHITVIAISSVNRQNYLSVMDFESFKESGNIEFTADVVWGLQLQAIHEDLFSQKDKLNEKRERIQRAKAESPRKIELICLKNRYGISSYNALFDYYSRVDLFVESDGFEPDKQNEGQSVFKGASGRKVLPPL